MQEAFDCFKTAAAPDTQSKPMVFERAYCLYALGRYTEALTEIGKVTQQPKPSRILELEAQIHFKLDDTKKTVSIYESLLSQPDYSDMTELVTNLAAAYIDAGMNQECQELINKKKAHLNRTYEFAFNAACLALSKGDIKNAESQLKLAKKVCVDTLTKDGFSEAEIQDEATSINVQLAYCQQLGGNSEAAIAVYDEIIAKEIGDSASLVAVNNLLAIRNDRDYAAALESLKPLLTEASEIKLTSTQKKTIHFNHLILLLQLKKVSQCEDVVKSLKKKHANATDLNQDLDLVVASLYIKDKKWKEAESLLKPQKTLKAQLLLAQLYLLDNNNIEKALGVLQSLDTPLQSKPGVLATKIALYEKSGDFEKAVGSLDTLITSLESKKKMTEKEEESYISLLKQSGNFKMNHQKYREAASMYEKVLKIDVNDRFALTSFIVAASHFDPTLSQKYEARLPPIKFNDSKVDVDVIDKLGIAYEKTIAPPVVEVVTPSKKKGGKPVVVVAPVKKVAIRVKKIKRLPKNYTPDSVPDPERWLPKWQRSYNRSRAGQKGKKKDMTNRGPQGVSSSTQSAQLAASVTPSASAQQSNVKQQATAKPRNINKKKGNKKK
eukprot:gene7870-9238_t